MFTMFFMIIFATLFIVSSSARPSLGFEERDQTISPCFLSCTNIALSAVGCNGISDLNCLCNSAAFRNVLTSCVHQMCPDQDDETATFQAQECAGYSTLSATALISGATLTSNPVTSTPITHISAASSSPSPVESTTGATIPNPSAATSDTFAHLGNNNNDGSQNSSNHTGIIIGAVVGVVVLMTIIFFLYWWRRRVHTGRPIGPWNRMSFAGGDGAGHSYQGAEATVRPWTYPASSASRSSPRPFILSTTPLTKPQPSSPNHGYLQLRSPAEQGTSEHSGTSPSTSSPTQPPRRLTRSSGQRISLPPPAYQPSSNSAKYGSWKQLYPSTPF